MATHDGHYGLFRVESGRGGRGGGGEETRGADDVEGRYAENAGGVEDTGFFERAGDDGYGRVDGVRDDEDVRLGGDAGDGGGEVADDGGVGL